jgi:hypothetical protein
MTKFNTDEYLLCNTLKLRTNRENSGSSISVTPGSQGLFSEVNGCVRNFYNIINRSNPYIRIIKVNKWNSLHRNNGACFKVF